MDGPAQAIIVAALERGNTPSDATALAGVPESLFWRDFRQGEEDAEAGRNTEAARFWREAGRAEAQFADELLARSQADEDTKAILSVLSARHERWSAKRAEAERLAKAPPNNARAILFSPEAREKASELLALISSPGPSEGTG